MKETNIKAIYDKALEIVTYYCVYSENYITKQDFALYATMVYIQAMSEGEITFRVEKVTLITGKTRISLIVDSISTDGISPRRDFEYTTLEDNLFEIISSIEVCFLKLSL